MNTPTPPSVPPHLTVDFPARDGPDCPALQHCLANFAHLVVQSTATYLRMIAEVDALRMQADLSPPAQKDLDDFIAVILTHAGQTLLALVQARGEVTTHPLLVSLDETAR